MAPPSRALLLAIASIASSSLAQPALGPYNTTCVRPHPSPCIPTAFPRGGGPLLAPSLTFPRRRYRTYSDPVFDSSDPRVWAWWPTNGTPGQRFPLIPYLHGVLGGDLDLLGYTAHFGQLASYGFVVVGTFGCNTGCHDAHNSSRWTACGGLLPLQPVNEGWDSYYGEAYKIIEWASNMSASPNADPVFGLIDFAAGAAVVGHSMGGQGAAMAGGAACTKQWGVKTVVLHHPAKGDVPWGNIGSNISVPVAAFTTSGDAIWPETVAIMDAFWARGDQQPYAYRDEAGWSHLEPVLWPPIENPFLATFTAAWLKVWLNGDRGEYYDLVFGSAADSMCGHAEMVNCSSRAPPA